MSEPPHRVDGQIKLVREAAPVRSISPRMTVLAAATIAAGLLLAVLLRPGQSPSVPLVWWLPVDQAHVRLRADLEFHGSSEFLLALEAYRERRAAEAADLLSAAEVPYNYGPLRDIYLASALILSGRSDEAEPILGRIEVDTLPPPWRHRAQWLVYVTLYERQEIARADLLLEQLCAAPGEVGEIARAERERR